MHEDQRKLAETLKEPHNQNDAEAVIGPMQQAFSESMPIKKTPKQ